MIGRIVDHVADNFTGKTTWKKRRHKNWRRFRKEYVKKNPKCIVCGSKKNLEVHHILKFSDYPQFELKNDNLATLCRRDHLIFGHLDSYHSANPDVIYDAWVFNKKIKER